VQRVTALAVHEAESGVLVTVTRHETPVAHLISDERLGALLETLELTGNPEFAATLQPISPAQVGALLRTTVPPPTVSPVLRPA
jgi:antitoxin (DNA-binding transcriptional repressor) of toxin-antitoxin stability system